MPRRNIIVIAGNIYCSNHGIALNYRNVIPKLHKTCNRCSALAWEM